MYFKYLIQWISFTVIGGIFTYRMIDSFLNNIFLPALDITLPNSFFSKLCPENINEEEKKIMPGIFLKEFVIWFVIINLLYLASKHLKK